MMTKYKFYTFYEEYIPNLQERIIQVMKKTYNHIDENWSIDLADKID